jgi:hypothetical protein
MVFAVLDMRHQTLWRLLLDVGEGPEPGGEEHDVETRQGDAR